MLNKAEGNTENFLHRFLHKRTSSTEILLDIYNSIGQTKFYISLRLIFLWQVTDTYSLYITNQPYLGTTDQMKYTHTECVNCLPLGSHIVHILCTWLWEESTGTRSDVSCILLVCFKRGPESDGLDSRFCSGQKFLLGFRDLFFCLFLERVSAVPSESSSALFWHTVFFTSEPWLLPLATGSFGL